MSSKRVLILGAGGMLGHMAVRVLSNDHEVFGTTRASKNQNDPLARFLRDDAWVPEIDVRDIDALSALLHNLKPEVVVNCVGLVKQKWTLARLLTVLRLILCFLIVWPQSVQRLIQS